MSRRMSVDPATETILQLQELNTQVYTIRRYVSVMFYTWLVMMIVGGVIFACLAWFIFRLISEGVLTDLFAP